MYQHIMVPLDGSELAECVLPHVRTIAIGCDVVEVTLVRVVESLHMRYGMEVRIPPEERQRIETVSMDKAKAYLEQIEKSLKETGIAARSDVLHGGVVEKLIDYVNVNDVDLTVVSTHGRSGLSRWVLGSVADPLLRSACVPVLMVRAPGCVTGL